MKRINVLSGDVSSAIGGAGRMIRFALFAGRGCMRRLGEPFRDLWRLVFAMACVVLALVGWHVRRW